MRRAVVSGAKSADQVFDHFSGKPGLALCKQKQAADQ